jgi:hypothetical protein
MKTYHFVTTAVGSGGQSFFPHLQFCSKSIAMRLFPTPERLIAWHDKSDPTIQDGRDAIIRVTACARAIDQRRAKL